MINCVIPHFTERFVHVLVVPANDVHVKNSLPATDDKIYMIMYTAV